jgi:hypothetical protein
MKSRRFIEIPGSSCPALCRASTPFLAVTLQDVDGRNKPGHDETLELAFPGRSAVP